MATFQEFEVTAEVVILCQKRIPSSIPLLYHFLRHLTVVRSVSGGDNLIHSVRPEAHLEETDSPHNFRNRNSFKPNDYSV